MNRTTQVPSSGQPVQETLGGYKFIRIRAVNAPLQVSFDGNDWHYANLNDQITAPVGADRIYFKSPTSVALAVTFSYGNTPFTAQDTSQSASSTVPQGNLNIANGSAAGAVFAGSPACDVNGFLTVTNAMLLKVPGTNAQGNRRQILILAVSANGAALQVLVSPTVGFTSIAPGTTFPFVSDSDFYISGSGGSALVTIGEFYLRNNG